MVQARLMEIFFVTTELSPFVKVGGLADVSAALPKALKALGHKVTVVVPRYAAFDEGLLMARRLTPLRVTLGETAYDVTVFDGRLSSQVDLTLIDVPGFWNRPSVFGEGEDYPDNPERFAVFSRAVAELVQQRLASGGTLDALHLNDWPTALTSKYLKDMGVAVPTLLTIHNASYQGIFPKDALPRIGLSWDDFTVGGIEFFGSVNFLKQGILSADAVSTVSPTYAQEIQEEPHGCRLEGVLRAKERVVGIVNGVDASVWNPATDSNLAARYDAEDPSNKGRCKGALQKELGLSLESSAPLVMSLGRVVSQKGSDLLAESLVRLVRGTDAQFVIAGEGDPSLMAKLDAAVQRTHGRAIYLRGVSESMAHRLFAAADIALVPSRFEPCGLVQMYAQRYGSLPVAHATGGLVDTIVDCDARLETGTGFLFDAATVEGLCGAFQRALSAYGSESWGLLRRRVMRLDRGWERAARHYDQLYQRLVAK